MQTPLSVRPLTADERASLETGLRSASAFTVRRCQILLASAEGQSTTTIAHDLRCTDQTVRNAIHAFHQRGLAVLQPLSSRPHTIATIFDAGACEALRALLHQSPRTFDKPTSRWTLQLAAEVSCAQGLTPRLVSDEAIRVALRRLGVSWKRAKHWITSPDPAYARKKNGATGSSSGPTPSRRGRWGLATKSGGVASPSPISMVGPRQRPRINCRN
jgi:transposase